MDALVASIKDRLSAAEVPFYDGEPPTGQNAPNKYGVFYLSLPSGGEARSSDDRPLPLVTLALIYAGKSPAGCRDVAMQGRMALEGARLLPGSEPVHLEGTQVRPDRDKNPPVWTVTDVAQFRVPANLIYPEEP